jgi:HAMP domain-containing protein
MRRHAEVFLRTRVARRVLGLFLLCAMLPLTLLALYGYGYLADELESRARDDLRSQSKVTGMIVLDRLAGLSASLELLAFQTGPDRPSIGAARRTTAIEFGPRFQGLLLEHGDGRVEALVGEIEPLPVLDRPQLDHLASGRVALISRRETSGVAVFLVRATQGGGRLWGKIDPGSVWDTQSQNSPAPTGTLACIATGDLEPLSCPAEQALAALRPLNTAPTLTWTKAGEHYIGGQWTIFLGRLYGAPSWRVLLSAPEQNIYAPLNHLRWTFFLGLTLALAAVFALSHIQLRRTMQPLEALEAGTRRLAAGDFGEPVLVRSDDEFQALAGSFNRMAGDLEQQFHAQRALERVHRAALAATGPEPVLDALFTTRQHLLPGSGLAVALAQPDDPCRWTVVEQSDGPRARVREDVQPRLAELEELRDHPDGLVVRRGERARTYFPDAGAVLFNEVMVLPIVRKGNLGGALVVPCRPEEEGRDEVLASARESATRIVVAICNAQLVEQLDTMSWGALTTLARTIDAVSPWTAGHSERVTLGAMEIGRRLGISEENMDLLHRGGLLHDIGKIGIPAAILDKPGALTAEEFATVRTHPAVGARILAPIGAFRAALPLVLHHHEMLDGSGYPHGLKGDQIPPLVRILTVADVFDALVSDRPYRPAWPVDLAVQYLREGVGIRFDADAVEVLTVAIADGWSAKPARDAASTRSMDTASYSLCPDTRLPLSHAEVTQGHSSRS